MFEQVQRFVTTFISVHSMILNMKLFIFFSLFNSLEQVKNECDVGNNYPCPLPQDALNLTVPMLEKLVERYENQIKDLEDYLDNLNALHNIIQNITTREEDRRIISDCSSFAKFLQLNLDDLEFKRRVELFYCNYSIIYYNYNYNYLYN